LGGDGGVLGSIRMRQPPEQGRHRNAGETQLQRRRAPPGSFGTPASVNRPEKKSETGADAEHSQGFPRIHRIKAGHHCSRGGVKKAAAKPGKDGA